MWVHTTCLDNEPTARSPAACMRRGGGLRGPQIKAALRGGQRSLVEDLLRGEGVCVAGGRVCAVIMTRVETQGGDGEA